MRCTALLALVLATAPAAALDYDPLQGHTPPVEGSPEEAEAKLRAKGVLDEGNRLFEEKKAAAALAKFESAYRVFPSPKILLNVAEAHRSLGHDEAALFFYERFLSEARPPTDSKQARAAASRIEALRAKRPRTAEPPVVAAQRPAPDEPPPSEPEPPLPAAETTAAAAPAETTPDLEPRASPEPVAITQPPPVEARDDEDGGVTTKWWFWAGIGVVLVAGTAAAVAAASPAEPFAFTTELGTTSTAEWSR